MQKLFNRFKSKLPERNQLVKLFAVFLVVSFFTTYFGIAISKQDTLIPSNPFDESTNNSEVHLNGNYQDLVHAAELDENEQEDSEERSEQEGSNHENDNKETNEGDGKHNEYGLGEGSHDPNAQNIEITGDYQGGQHRTNHFFTTSIKDGEVVTEKDYHFSIQQLEHKYIVKNIHVNVSPNEEVVSKTDHDDGPVQVHLTLAENANKIRVTVTYEDDEENVFSVSRTYVVLYDKDHIVIESDLEDGQIVYQEKLTFHASAKRGADFAPISVVMNSNEVQETGKNKYDVKLKEGKNEITIESHYKDNRAKKQFTIEYKKPQLIIQTNLKNQTVDQPKFNFTAIALDGNQQTNLSVTHDGNNIEENKDEIYSVTLSEGENTFDLTATKGDVTHSETYVVTYNPNASDGGKEEDNKYAPSIDIYDISDGQTLRSSSYTFHVRAKTHDGESITAGNGTITAKNNGSPVRVNWPDSDQISFTFDVQSGENNIVIDVRDKEGNSATRTLKIYGDLAEEGEGLGYITVSLEASTIGLGYIIAPKQVEIYQGENGAHVLDRILRSHGFDYDYTGSPENSFYLSAIYKEDLVIDPVIPEDLAERVERDMERFDPEDYLKDSLGEFDFTNGSGWMYSVNGNYPNVGFADYIFKEGDEVRIRFTLAYGADIGGGMPGTNYEKEW